MDIKTTYNVKVGTPESLTNFNKLSNKDLPLIQTQKIDTQFNQGKHRVDVHFYSLDGRLLQSKVNSTNYSIQAGSSNVLDEVVDIIVDPTKDVVDAGYENGDINVLYNFVNTLYSNSNTRPIFYVESISPDRREIRALTNDLDKDTIVDFTNQIKTRLEEQPYFEDFRTNFGKNKLPIAVNIETSEYKGDQAIFIRFYDALPTEFTVKSTFLVEELIGNSVLYEVTTKVDAETVDGTIALRGANFNIELVEENNNPTGYLSYDELFSYPVTNSYYEVYSLFNEKGAQISIDHSDFSEFVQFSSAEERIRNFYYKASLLESYRNQIDERTSLTASIEENIRGIVNNFDHYDRYLYFETGSDAWPKNSSTRPYTLFSTGSSEVQTWYTGKINEASLFDAQNQDRLTNTIPSFIREDLNNAPYSLFVDMIGQHFDNLWIYSKAVTSKYDADNRLDFGISKDLVRDAVENFGITLYNNNEALENLFSAFTGESYNSGSEDIRSLIVAVEGSGSLVGSSGNEHLQPMPKSSYQKEVYKRIYHNIPLLLKSKGTERGLRALINSLGVPSDTLSIKMYGGATESGSIFYGSETEFTSSLDKIRITNTDTVTTGSTLSSFTSVVNPGKDYSTDLHTVEVGFSPTDNLNKFIKAHPSMSSFNIDEYIGDPGLAYSSDYATLDELADTVFTSGSSYTNVYNAFDFVRLIKFFDNSLFRIIKDFVPARSNISTGIIIKPHILDRSKVKQPEVKWSNQTSPKFLHTSTELDFTGSYYSTNFSIDANIETAFITGSTGLDSGYTSSYTETYANPSGGFQTLTRNNHDEASYTGEFSGSIIEVSNGDLTAKNTFRKLEPEEFSFKYIPRNDFTANSSAIAGTGYQLGIVGQVGNVTSPAQSETGTAIEVTIDDIDDYFADFRISGGPNNIGGYPGGYPDEDTATVTYYTDEALADGETLLIDVTAEFGSAFYTSGYPDNSGLSKLVVEIISGSTVVATNTLQRNTSFNTVISDLRTATISYENNTGATLDGFTQEYYYRVRYSSNYNSIYSQNFIDASITFNPRRLVFDDDAITVWLSEDTSANYTASMVEALAIPLSSTTNGSMLEYVREAKEVVFEYPAYVPTDNYDNTVITSSVEGGSYRVSTSIQDNDILLNHITSAPYSASFTQALPDINPGENVEFNFTVDFDSYWNTYLNTYNLADTPFVTASIRNRTTGVVTDNLSFEIQQGQYPNEYKRSLKYENSTGLALSDLEFYYQVNVPKADKGAGNPVVNLKNIAINYRVPTVVFNKADVKSTQKLLSTIYVDIEPNIEVFSGSLTYFVPSTNYYKVGFIPGELELFRFNEYASTSNNVDSLRRSSRILQVDDMSYSPNQGPYRGFFLPGNYEVISSSIANGVQGLNERFFAQIQDSNYSSTPWRNPRYDGSKTTNRVGAIRTVGREPALTYEPFDATTFDSASITTDIKAKFTGSDQVEAEIVYYNSYELDQGLDTALFNIDSLETNSTRDQFTTTTYSFGMGNNLVGSGKFFGNLSPLLSTDDVSIEFTVRLQNIDAAELSTAGLTVTVTDTGDPTILAQSTFSGTDFTVGSTISKTISLEPSLDVVLPILEFNFTNFTGAGGGDPDVILTITSLKTQTLLPIHSNRLNIIEADGAGRTFFYRETAPTPTSPNGFSPLINSKIYRFGNNTVYTTDDKGIVVRIEE